MPEAHHRHKLGEFVRPQRLERGYSLRGLAATAGVDPSWVMRLERGAYASPDPRYLDELAGALEIDVAELYAAAGYRGAEGLPSLGVYLRAKYDLLAEAVEELAEHFDLLNQTCELGRQEGGSDDDGDPPQAA